MTFDKWPSESSPGAIIPNYLPIPTLEATAYKMTSWIEIAGDSDFSLQNLPYGVFSTSALGTRIGVAVGNNVLDLKLLAHHGTFEGLGFDTSCLQQPMLNAYAGLGRTVHRRVRDFLQDLLGSESSTGKLLRDNAQLRALALIPMDEAQMHLPMAIGDYTDFFVGPHHSKNVSVERSRIRSLG